jgi:hypothetical protein
VSLFFPWLLRAARRSQRIRVLLFEVAPQFPNACFIYFDRTLAVLVLRLLCFSFRAMTPVKPAGPLSLPGYLLRPAHFAPVQGGFPAYIPGLSEISNRQKRPPLLLFTVLSSLSEGPIPLVCPCKKAPCLYHPNCLHGFEGRSITP